MLYQNIGIKILQEKMINTTKSDLRKMMQFTPLLSVEVEMSFNQFKFLPNDYRICLSEKNIESVKMIMLTIKHPVFP